MENFKRNIGYEIDNLKIDCMIELSCSRLKSELSPQLKHKLAEVFWPHIFNVIGNGLEENLIENLEF